VCANYELQTKPQTIESHLKLNPFKPVPVFGAMPNIRPTHRAPIVRVDNDKSLECVLAQWGLIPAWAKDARFGANCLNARCETLQEKPSFRNAFRSQRALIPATAYFEWPEHLPENQASAIARVDGRTSTSRPVKKRYRFALPDDELFMFAGLWERWRAPEQPEAEDSQGSWLETFTIITSEPNATVAPLHDRMPVILKPSEYDQWLNGTTIDVLPLLRPWSGAAIHIAHCPSEKERTQSELKALPQSQTDEKHAEVDSAQLKLF
jgi:putative SOS response-associated peptidase YedK